MRADTLRSSVKVGEHVRIVTRDTKVFELEVTAVEKDAVAGTDATGNHRLAYAQIKTIEVRKVSALKTTGVVLLGVAGAFLLALFVSSWELSRH